MPEGVYVYTRAGTPYLVGGCLVDVLRSGEVTNLIESVTLQYSPGAQSCVLEREGGPLSLPLMHSPDCPCRAYFHTRRETLLTHKRISLCACAIVESADGRLLLTRRDPRLQLFPRAWVFPGGHVDRGESVDAAVLREIAEETGIDLVPTSIRAFLLYESVFPSLLSAGLPLSQHLIVFYHIQIPAAASSLEMKENKEVDMSVWLSREELQLVLSDSSGSAVGTTREGVPTAIDFSRLSGASPNACSEGMGRAHILAATYWLQH